ncbi:cation:proton antiporter [Pigmentiphaga aceris]|uniref:Cation:proton antiporter n=1 Tax=Pigmentiphaga aceris TaxID=1940612 RepID=A0A5C0B2G2_9BURK|nr:monovalent cation/H(+) antiporter subunit G [Pigmentiphaga aceris]QEI06797.1 cation:proton antiporter [Pigmentiphaga aceris]
MNLEDVPLWAALPASLLLVLGSLIALVGAVGLLRLREFLTRFHAPALGTTLGTLCILAASILVFSAVGGRPVVHEVLIYIFLTMTAPVTAMLLVRAALYRKRERPAEEDAEDNVEMPQPGPEDAVLRK